MSPAVNSRRPAFRTRGKDSAGNRTAGTLAAAAATPAPPFTQCPPVGLNSSCAVLIEITDAGTRLFDDPTQGPFDGVEDTLVGVVNSSGRPVGSLALSSDTDLFGFDGDGLCAVSPQPSGCPFGQTGYEGPKTSFSNITPDASGGVVNFTGGLAPGGTTYFSLEERLASTAITVGGPTKSEVRGGGNPSEHPTTCPAGRPVDCATGEFWHQFDDLAIPGRGVPLRFRRTYSSAAAGADGPLGFGWTHSYNLSLDIDSAGNVTVIQENGSTVAFRPNGSGGYTAPPRVLATLDQDADGTFTFTRRPDHVRYLFSASGKLMGEVDRNGYRTDLTYGASGQLDTVTDPAGRQLSFAYAGTRISQITDPLGRTASFAYDADGNLTRATDPAGHSWTFTYDAAHLLLTMTDPNRGVTTNSYDGTNRVIKQVDPADRTMAWTYAGDPTSPAGATTTMTAPNGNVTTYNYADLELLSVTHGTGTPDAATTTYAYDPATLGITTITDPNSKVTANNYDRNGNLLSSTDALGNATTYSYNSLDEPLTRTTPLGETTTNTYDSNGNLQSVTRPLQGTGSTETVSYNYEDSVHPGDVTSRIDPNGNSWRYTYDANGNLTSSTDPAGNKTSYGYDAIGRRTTVVAPRGNASGADPARFTTSYHYDALGDLTKVTDPLGHTSTFAYDLNRNRTSATDPNGNVTRYSYNADDELTAVKQADGSTLSYAYDANGNQTAQTDAAGNTTSYGYDALDRLVASSDPLHRTTSYGYDKASNRTSLTDPAGRTTRFDYDQTNRLTTITYSDAATPNVSYSYDADGHRTQMTDGTGSTTYSYDSLDRLVSSTNGAGATVGYGYDVAGQLTSLTYPNGKTVTRSYDPAGRLSMVTDWLGNTTNFDHDPDANLTSEAYPNGVKTTASYDNADQVTSITHQKGTTRLASLDYARDSLGQVTSTTPTGVPGGPESYSYTSLNQLASLNGQPYAYDHADNLTRKADGTTQSFDAAGQLQTSIPPSTGSGTLAVDRTVSADRTTRSSKLAAPPITTHARKNLVLAFVSADGPAGSHQRVRRVTGGGLHWTLATRANPIQGTAEVWRARTNHRLVRVTVKARLRYRGFHRSITVAAFKGAARRLGAKATASGPTGSPTLSMTTTKAGSLIWAVGHDPSHAQPRTPNSSQTIVHQFIDRQADRSFWVQRTEAIPDQGSKVEVGDTEPADDGWELAAVEINPAGSGRGSSTPVSYGYDSQGNRTTMTPAGGTPITLAYDQANRLTAYGTAATYVYNGDGLRMSKTVTGEKRAFAWDESGRLPLLLADGSDYYIYGASGLPMEKISGSTVSYLHHDQQGSTRLLTNATGAVVGTYAYDPHGRIVSHTGSADTTLQYGGQYTDAETAFQYLRARYYDPATGQFISRDPIEAVTLQSYAYVGNNPLNYVDPTGLICLSFRCVRHDVLHPIALVSGVVQTVADATAIAAGVVAGVAIVSTVVDGPIGPFTAAVAVLVAETALSVSEVVGGVNLLATCADDWNSEECKNKVVIERETAGLGGGVPETFHTAHALYGTIETLLKNWAERQLSKEGGPQDC